MSPQPTMIEPQHELDRRNQTFWSELCGSGLARQLGITDASRESLARFDHAYMALYPYLSRYVPADQLRGRRVVEIGLGYGTLGQLLAGVASEYHGIDISPGPVAMMRHRLAQSGIARGSAAQGSALDLPLHDASVDFVYSIGCLHHTGDVGRSVEEIHRVLRPNGRAVIMLYNQHSFRRLVWAPLSYVRHGWFLQRRRPALADFARASYDVDSQGAPAPHTDFHSRRDIRRLFRRFSSVTVESQNIDPWAVVGRIVIPRERLLGSLGRILGLDLYVVARK
ncbi:MAG: hypothetical protein DMD91_21235 [Candidatus Rokuibacteriota bacterium]|nr:MAG: hypothetical protein DMD91_21235 [Candidatus Rokubacteria bacterium]